MTASSFILTLAATTSARAPEAHGPQLLDVDGTVFLSFGLFLLTMFALNSLLWKPYLRVREARSTRVEGYKEDAKRIDADATTRLGHVEAELAEARRAGSQERARVRIQAQKREQEILSTAQAAAQKSLADARSRIETALTRERATLAARAETLGHEAAERILGRKVAS
jgi:F-type H+-transporting ATPase subunit b